MDEDLDDLDYGSGDEEDDPLDAAENFNPVQYVSRRFQNEASMAGLDAFIGGLNQQREEIDEDIRKSIRQQAVCGRRAREELEEAKAAIADLFERIQALHAKAEQSDVLVNDVCRDVKSLDVAKRNLTLTVTALKRLAMLITAMEQLKCLAKARRYKEASLLVHAIEELAESFQALLHIPRVNHLVERKNDLIREMRYQLQEDYASLHGPEHGRQAGLESAAGCVDAIGAVLRRDIISQFCNRLLEGYKDIFQPPKQFSTLESAERRYAWLKRSMREYDEKYACHFPDSWRVPCALCEHFCQVTRQHLVEVLSMSVHTVDPELMVRVLRKSIDFENDLADRYPADVRIPVGGNAGRADFTKAASNFGFKYPEVLGVSTAATSSSSSSAPAERKAGQLPREASVASFAPRFKGIISECFDAYLSSWVQHEEKQLLNDVDRSMLAGVDRIIGRDDDDDDGGMDPKLSYHSATALFVSLKNSVSKCSGFSTHQTLFDIFQVSRKVVAQYMEKLKSKFPERVSAPLDSPTLQACCCVIGTLEYCDEMLPQLAAEVLDFIDPAFEERVHFDQEQDLLRSVMNRANHALVASVSCGLDDAFLKMTRSNWAKFSREVGDNSPFVGEISEKLSRVFEPIAGFLSKIHYRFFCDKFVQHFVARYIEEIFRCRKISEQGAKQLLQDTSEVKTTLLEAPVTVGSGRQMPTAYSNYVLREMGRAEKMLHVLSIPDVTPLQAREVLGDTAAALADHDVRRLLALRAASPEEPPAIGASRDREVTDMASGLKAMGSTMMSLGEQLNQKGSKTHEDLKKNIGDVKNKLLGVASLGLGRKS
eukprot:TRINITY_DN36798_c0_g1_i1.p1 TRINITY_DN36798_c0_g1~~TRINITY_DN36798_c0_g1_i1.p1  ORF type:complete len:845 (-),score=228.34 TRINITY_DN36798_c0_g1_i1:149-2623(-)